MISNYADIMLYWKLKYHGNDTDVEQKRSVVNSFCFPFFILWLVNGPVYCYKPKMGDSI